MSGVDMFPNGYASPQRSGEILPLTITADRLLLVEVSTLALLSDRHSMNLQLLIPLNKALHLYLTSCCYC